MSFAEIVLRIGVTFVSWMMIYMHLVMLLVVSIAPCDGGDASPWQVTLFTGLLAFGGSFTSLYVHGVRGMGAVFRYFALPLVVLAPWAVWIILPYLSGTTFDGLSACGVRLAETDAVAAAGWQRIWAPMQLIVLAALAFNGWRGWQPDRNSNAP